MIKAVDYLSKRDIDGDGLLEQKHNEDWMDTAVRAGKIVYSQACWIIALNDLSILLSNLGQDAEASKMRRIQRDKAMDSVEQKMWSQKDGCYVNKQETLKGDYRETLTLKTHPSICAAMTADTEQNNLRMLQKEALANQEPPKPLDSRLLTEHERS